MDYNNMTPLQLDALKEVSNIGTGNALQHYHNF